MKRSRFSEEQIIGILREGAGESSVKVVCAKHNISEPTYYAWKRKYGGMEVSEVDVQPWGAFVYFSDPDGNAWAVQELPPRHS